MANFGKELVDLLLRRGTFTYAPRHFFACVDRHPQSHGAYGFYSIGTVGVKQVHHNNVFSRFALVARPSAQIQVNLLTESEWGTRMSKHARNVR
jgi:hypothetical protein